MGFGENVKLGFERLATLVKQKADISYVDNIIGPANMIKTTNITVSNTAILLPSSELSDRKSIVVTNESETESIRVGDSTISPTKGTLIKKGQTMAFDIDSGLYGIRVGANDVVISVNELA